MRLSFKTNLHSDTFQTLLDVCWMSKLVVDKGCLTVRIKHLPGGFMHHKGLNTIEEAFNSAL